MNPWARLLDPSAPVPKPSGPSRVHLMADAYDASAPRPRNRAIPAVFTAPAPRPPEPAPVLAHASIPEAMVVKSVPRKAAPPVAPGPAAYRVPAPPPKPAMTYAEAIAIRERARNKQPVESMLVLEANQLVQETRRRAMPAHESYGGEQ